VIQSHPRLLFLRGVDFSHSLGTSDWRIALFMPEFGFHTAVLGRGALPPSQPGQVELISMPACRQPLVGPLALSYLYALETLKRRPHVAVVNPGVASAGALCKALDPSIRLVLDIRTIPVESQGAPGSIRRAYFHHVLRSNVFDACSIISQGMLDLLDSQFHLRARMPTVVWGSGFDEEIFVPAVGGADLRQQLGLHTKFVLMFHGSLSPTRGLDAVIRSLRLLRDQGQAHLHLLLVGRGAAQAGLMALATELGVADQIHWIPPVPHVEIPAWIAVADLGLDPLPDHPWWHHQSPLKVYEYLALGKPVLATDLPCHRGISEAVLLVPDNQPSTLAASILRTSHLSQRERQRLSNVALRDAQRYTWRARAGTLAHFLHEQLDRV
jgi:glycosyltransferase involved in cell wall biosynthesis